MDVTKDKRGGKAMTHRNSLKVIQNIRDNLDLTDIWRDLNPEGRRYTWRQNKPEIHCRLDFFLVSVSLAGRIVKADILPPGGGGYSHKVRIGVCREGSSNLRMNQTKIDTLSKAQTRKMTPYAREEKRCVTIQTTNNRHGKHNLFKIALVIL